GVSVALERLWGTAPAPETLRQAALAEGGELMGRQREAAQDVVAGDVAGPEGGPRLLYVALDGGYARGRGKGQWHEAKLGAVYSDRRVRVSRNRHRLVGRVNVGTFGSSAELGELVYAAAFGQGVEQAQEVVVLGDGAGWIRTLQEHHFPHAELRLDAFHVLQALDKGLQAACPDDAGRRRRHKQVLGELIWDGRLKEAVRRLRLMAHHASPEAGALDDTIEYLEHQAPYIPAYGRLQERGEMISSALAEEAVDRLFNSRFKHQHRHWCPQSADPLLALRLLAADGQWEQYWHQSQNAA
ncbi:MAG: UPF0236 family protein, partial [Candidatus Brocadiaceae bacterium]